MRLGSLILAALLVTAALTGCIGDTGDDAIDQTSADEARDLDRTIQRESFSGTATTAQSGSHALEVGDDVVRFSATLSVQGTAVDGGSLTVYGPDGEALASGPNVTVHGLHIEKAGTGAYELNVFVPVLSGQADYEIDVRIVKGDQRPTVTPEPINATPPADEGVTVALVDTGINVYHEVFQRTPASEPAASDQAAGAPAKRVSISPGSTLEGSLVEDDPVWRGLERKTLYKFDGTNAYGISFVPEDASGEFYPVLDEYGHGTATAHSVLMNAPNATIVMVEVAATSWERIAEAISWTAEQDWIDVVSVSMGNTGNLPVLAGGDTENAMPKATQKVVESGKVYVNSAGNDPSFHYTDNADGPPWVVAVSGAEPSSKGRDVVPANGPDFVANFSVKAATHTSTDGYGWTQGTSFSAPSTAGSFADALLEVREATGHTGGIQDGALVDADGITVTHHDLREAFNRSAVYWDATSYDPTNPPGEGPGTQALGTAAPVLPAPWIQTGWGYVDGRVAHDAAQHLLGGEEQPAKPAPAQAHMQAQQDLRQQYWSAQMGS